MLCWFQVCSKMIQIYICIYIYTRIYILFILFSFLHFEKFYFVLEHSWLAILSSFQVTAKWFSYTYTCTYSFSNYFSIKVITEYSAKFPVLYSRSLLANYFENSSVYMSVWNSQSIPSLHYFPLVTVSLFFKSVRLFLFCK